MRRLKTCIDATIGALSLPLLLAKARHFDGLVAERDRLHVQSARLLREISDRDERHRREMAELRAEKQELADRNVALSSRLEQAEAKWGEIVP